jgi:hypothetical protein
MKSVAWIFVALFLVILWVTVRTRQSRNSIGAQQTPQPSHPEVYLGLRNMMLQSSRVKFGIAPGSKPTQPYGVLMDWGVETGSATVVAIADGTASVYLSSGGGFLGGGQSHESIRGAAKRTVELADEVQPLMQPTTTYPLPKRGQVIFYVLTDSGVFTAGASEDDLRGHRSPLFKLGDSAQTIITEYRQIPGGQ